MVFLSNFLLASGVSGLQWRQSPKTLVAPAPMIKTPLLRKGASSKKEDPPADAESSAPTAAEGSAPAESPAKDLGTLWNVRYVTCIVGVFGGTCAEDLFCYTNLKSKLNDEGVCVDKMVPGGACGMFDQVYHGHMCLDGVANNGGIQKFSCQVPEGAPAIEEGKEKIEATYDAGLQQGKCQPCCDTYTFTTPELKEVGCKNQEGKMYSDCPLPISAEVDSEGNVKPGVPLYIQNPNSIAIIEGDTRVCVGPFKAGEEVMCADGLVTLEADAPEACVTVADFAPGLVHKPLADEDALNSKKLKQDMSVAAASKAGLCDKKPEPEPKSEPKPESKPEPKPEPKPESKPESKPEEPKSEEEAPKDKGTGPEPAPDATGDAKAPQPPQQEEIKEQLVPSEAEANAAAAKDQAPVPE